MTELILIQAGSECQKHVNVTTVSQKNVPSAVVIYYWAWYVFLRDRRYLNFGKFYNNDPSKH